MSDRTAVRRRLGVIGNAPALLSLVVGLVVTLALVGSGTGSSQAAPISPPAPGSADAEPATASAPDAAHADEPDVPAVPAAQESAPARTGVLASVDGLELHLPSEEVVVAGFHQASSRGALAMDPVAARSQVLPSRGRGTERTSAVDLVLVDDEAVRSPVTGRVVETETYSLYGRHPDRRVTIRPKGRSDLRVVLLHVEGLRVEEGDRVEAGETVIAQSARRFPFRSQVDEETAPDAWPHVHLEVTDVG
jgi:biotin carboxyl carrier protein